MGYLEVKISEGVALSANGISLATDTGFLASLFGTAEYPSLAGYIEGLENEGWRLVSTETQNIVGTFDGLPFYNQNKTLIFRGYGRYLIEWNENKSRWRFQGDYDEDEY